MEEPFDFEELRNYVRDGMDQMQAAEVILDVVEALSSEEGTEDERFATAVEVVRSYGDRRAMNSVGGQG